MICGSVGTGRRARLRILCSLRTCGFKSHLPHFLGIKRVYQKAPKPSKINGFGAFSCLNLSHKNPSFLPHSAPFLPHRFFIISLLNIKLESLSISNCSSTSTNLKDVAASTSEKTIEVIVPSDGFVTFVGTFSANASNCHAMCFVNDIRVFRTQEGSPSRSVAWAYGLLCHKGDVLKIENLLNSTAGFLFYPSK